MKMKLALIAIFSILVFITVEAIGETDYSQFTDEELIEIQNAVHDELMRRNTNNSTDGYGQLIYNKDGLEVFISEPPYIANNIYGKPLVIVNIVVINHSNIPVVIKVEDIYLNDWKLDCYETITVDSGRKAKEKFTFLVFELEVVDKEPIKSFEIPFIILNYNTYREVDNTGPIIYNELIDKR